MTQPVARVHVVFKTHLDIGFTDLAGSVAERYLRVFIPRALDTAEVLAAEGESFVWTTGSWLVDEYLRRAAPPERARMESAIGAGRIAWHGMPFTTHSELMDPWLAEAGLAIGARLDARFGRETIAAKLSDVPGHTVGLLPLLAARGIRYLHVGVNGGSRVPELPRLFRWRAPGGSEILVHYSGGYGDELALPGLAEALVIANSADNSGPPGPEEARRIIAETRARYPGARVFASTLDAFARALLPLAPSLPLVEDEIGDSWIHGAASDPRKLAGLRALLRLRAGWAARGLWDEEAASSRDFARNLLLVVEHTWGLDTKKHLGDWRNWSKAGFAAARARDLVGPDSVPEELRFVEDFAREEFLRLFPEEGPARWARRSYSYFESSHAEQRAYLEAAAAALPEPLRAEAAGALSRIASPPRREAPAAAREARAGEPLLLGPYLAAFAQDGSLASLRAAPAGGGAAGAGPELASAGGIGALRYQALGPGDYEAYLRGYGRDREANLPWFLADFGKPGLEAAFPRPEAGLYAPRLDRLTLFSEDGRDLALCELSFGGDLCAISGAPRRAALRYAFPVRAGEPVELEASWSGKDPSRLPEALWLSICLAAERPGLWRLRKLGTEVDPASVVAGGNRQCHAVWEAAYRGPDGERRVEPLDSALVAPGERRLLCADDRLADPAGGLHFALYGNLWGTNFPQWFGEDAAFGFRLSLPLPAP
ncbi:MAG TPA: DUF5054 domain-containing protein [Spirochaetales bacterium]|nr:DUF5054 domain-containing protein [Spirochaetales bacterium]HRY54137.1 DUF5054 domain-containing protein [Spirochaetia bacterium]HRZ63931.1 DUF5054 domain-containing protein [Spirochaetia bacterium]